MTSTNTPTPDETILITAAYGRKVRGGSWEIVYIERSQHGTKG